MLMGWVCVSQGGAEMVPQPAATHCSFVKGAHPVVFHKLLHAEAADSGYGVGVGMICCI